MSDFTIANYCLMITWQAGYTSKQLNEITKLKVTTFPVHAKNIFFGRQ